MKKVAVFVTSLFLGGLSGFNSYVYADSPAALTIAPALVLDKVAFQLSSKQWVKTDTALVSVSINATLSNADLVQARADIMLRLNKIAQGEWHLVQFDRSQDNSGLEKLFVDAQVRVSQSTLTDIYKNAKEASKPGATYTINSIDFKPSASEVQQAKIQLRQRLYQMVAEEIARLNKAYPTQVYSVNSVLLYDGDAPPPMPQPMQATMNKTFGGAAPSAAPELSVSNEIIMTAVVEAASQRRGS